MRKPKPSSSSIEALLLLQRGGEWRSIVLTAEAQALAATLRADETAAAPQNGADLLTLRHWAALRRDGLAFFLYAATPAGLAAATQTTLPGSVDVLVDRGFLAFRPIAGEDDAGGRHDMAAADLAQPPAERQRRSLADALSVLGLAALPLQSST